MDVRFLGTGSAFTLKNYQTNFLISKNGRNLLFDAGSDIRFSLAEQGLSYKDVHAIYVSHLHSDHAGGIESLAFCSYFDPLCPKPLLIGDGVLLRRGWEETWRGGLESTQNKKMALWDYFDVQKIRQDGVFMWEGISFSIVPSIHVMNGYYTVRSNGLLAHDIAGNWVYFTSDVQHLPDRLRPFYESADLIIQDCETSPFPSGVHSHFTELAALPNEIKAKMHLVHYQDNVLSDRIEWDEKARTAGFAGFAHKGQVLADI